MRRKTRCDGERTREAIVAAAADAFAARGYDGASMREICRAAGANSALAGRYFGSKAGLYRAVAKRLFGDLGRPLADLKLGVRTGDDWRAALRTWIDDFLFMTLPDRKPQRLCAALFRHEVTRPTKFHAEFKTAFGLPVYDALESILARTVKDAAQRRLWTTSIWAQVSVYALADRKWVEAFRPRGRANADWRADIRDFICDNIFERLTR